MVLVVHAYSKSILLNERKLRYILISVEMCFSENSVLMQKCKIFRSICLLKNANESYNFLAVRGQQDKLIRIYNSVKVLNKKLYTYCILVCRNRTKRPNRGTPASTRIFIQRIRSTVYNPYNIIYHLQYIRI